jgi:hypothetical protein
LDRVQGDLVRDQFELPEPTPRRRQSTSVKEQ